jgi:CHAD domain-containing protein
MAYHLKSDESVPDGIKRIADEQIEKAVAQLTDQTDDSPDEAVHNARKRLKQIRALLRLVRDEIDEDIYHRENASFRDAGRLLSDVRDAQVNLETLDKLTKYFADYISPNAFEDLRQALMVQIRTVNERVFEQNNATEKAALMLLEAQERIKALPIEADNWSALKGGFKKVYHQGYKDFPQAFNKPSAENFHEWRKRVKDLWYQLRILQPIWPGLIKEMANQTKELADYLGDDHDLAVLRQLLLDQPELLGEQAELDILLGLIDRRRMELQLSAKALGKRIYAEKPRRFVKRLKAYWQVWQSQINQPPIEQMRSHLESAKV